MSDLPLAKKSLGQHWLSDTTTLSAICEAADVNSNDTIVEIGPGTGTLTRELVKRAKNVIAIEFDSKLANELIFSQIAKNLQIIKEDILKFDFTTLSQNYKIVANIPYYLTSHLLRILSESSNPPSIAVLLVQKEVAERVAAKPGEMSLLSVSTQFYWEVSQGMTVPAKLFTPPPKVDSQILTLKRRLQPLFPDIDESVFFRLVKAGFASRRKTLHNSLSAGLRIGKSELNQSLTLAKIDPGLRAQALSLPDWYTLFRAMSEQKLL